MSLKVKPLKVKTVKDNEDIVTLHIELPLQGPKQPRFEFSIDSAKKEMSDRGFKVEHLVRAKIANNVSDRRRHGFYVFKLQAKKKSEPAKKTEPPYTIIYSPFEEDKEEPQKEVVKKKPTRRKRPAKKRTTETKEEA